MFFVEFMCQARITATDTRILTNRCIKIRILRQKGALASQKEERGKRLQNARENGKKENQDMKKQQTRHRRLRDDKRESE